MSNIFVLLDDIYDENEKEKLVKLERKFNLSSISVMKSTEKEPMLEVILEASNNADYVFFKDQALLDRCHISKSFMDDFLTQINMTGYFLDHEEFIGKHKFLPTVEVVVFSNEQSFCKEISNELGEPIHIDMISDIDQYDLNDLVKSVTNQKPTYVIFDLNYILSDFGHAMQLLNDFKQKDQHVWVPQLDLDSRVIFAHEFLDEIEENYYEFENSLKPTVLS